ncbi:MAG: family 20 glycosylhydrolase [Rikenellaceae bacterium]|nr:family 20 glycosylhydrolase [Rikenellaceae bacterium]
MKSLLKLWVLCAVLPALSSCRDEMPGHFGIIPQPVSIERTEGYFNLTGKTVLICHLAPEETAVLQNAGLPGQWRERADGSDGTVVLSVDRAGNFAAGAYRLEIAPDGVEISAGDVPGLFYALQSLRQLNDNFAGKIPCAVIEDRPRMQYRALLLDVSHNFLSVDFLKKQIDMMARLKMNRLVLFLASDGGWRFEVPEYPELTEYGAWRPVESYGLWKENGGGFCKEGTPGAYGGYYTAEDISEIVEFARERFVEIIPAIDFPCAHGNIAALVEGLECRSNVWNREGETAVMENILEGLIAVFPSEYIYLGDGKASDPQSISCLECQPKVEKGKTGNISDNRHGPLIPHLEEFIGERGVKPMLWEESLRGVVADDAAVVAWHDPDEAVTVAEMGYDVVVSPLRYASLDFYQTDPSEEAPSTMGFLPLEMIYNFEPLLRTLGEEYSSRIMGFQGNLWTYDTREGPAAERKLYPRLFAVAELGWTVPERKSYPDFRRRAAALLPMLKSEGYGYFDLADEVTGREEAARPVGHKGSGKPVEYIFPFNRTYPGVGDRTLADGWRGGWVLDDGRWQGFFNNDICVVVDLGDMTEITSVSADFVRHRGARIALPSVVEISVSGDGEDFRLVGEIPNGHAPEEEMFAIETFQWKGRDRARYVRFTARAPEWEGAGGWMFTDEIIIE